MTQRLRFRVRRRNAFTVVEALIVSGLMVLLAVLLSSAWSGLGRPLADAVGRCRVTQEASLALASLARDYAGSLPDAVGEQVQGRLVGRQVIDGSELWLCFDGGSPDGVADWGPPDTVIIYEVQSNHLIRRDQNSGDTFTVARDVDAMDLTELGDGVQIDLTLHYRDITRTYTMIAKDP